MERRPATAAEAKALANPLRLRILRLCLHQPMTNKELADALGKEPGALLHHVRTLQRTGFLDVAEVRTGRRGAVEKPYRATGKSWTLDIGERTVGTVAMLEAFRSELAEAGPDAVVLGSRFALRLTPAAAAEFETEMSALIDRYVARQGPDGDSFGVFVGMHRTRSSAPADLDRTRAIAQDLPRSADTSGEGPEAS